MEIRVHQQSFQAMKEVSDRALKLAETGKPQGNGMLQGLLGVAA